MIRQFISNKNIFHNQRIFVQKKKMMKEVLTIYIIGVLVARWQLWYWFKSYILIKEDADYITILSALSWAIYPAYLIGYLLEHLKIK